jgi:hypothetical protein
VCVCVSVCVYVYAYVYVCASGLYFQSTSLTLFASVLVSSLNFKSRFTQIIVDLLMGLSLADYPSTLITISRKLTKF